MGNGIAHVCALAGYEVLHPRRRRRTAIEAGMATIERQPGPPGRSGKLINEDDAQGRARPHRPRRRPMADLADRRPRHRGGDRGRRASSARSYAQLCPQLKPDAILATNTSSISITRLAARDRPARALHRHAFHEPGAGDEAGRAHPRHRHRGRDLRGRQGVRRASSARRITVSEDFPAFIVNRILLPMINEAIYTL